MGPACLFTRPSRSAVSALCPSPHDHPCRAIVLGGGGAHRNQERRTTPPARVSGTGDRPPACSSAWQTKGAAQVKDSCLPDPERVVDSRARKVFVQMRQGAPGVFLLRCLCCLSGWGLSHSVTRTPHDETNMAHELHERRHSNLYCINIGKQAERKVTTPPLILRYIQY